MRYLLTSLLFVLTLSLTAQGYGCTYITASNYNSEAIADDGSCEFGSPNVFDYDNDGNIAINDFIAMLSYFGDTDSDSDGVFDSEDDCIDDTACNYQSNPTYLCYYLDVVGVCGGICNEDADGDGICDFECGEDLAFYDGYGYSTVQIGEHCWFSENCRYLPSVSPSSADSDTDPYFYVFGYQGTDIEAAKATTNYETFGVLYNWPAVMTAGICPSGWHIPSDGELTQLTDLFGGESVAGYSMKDDIQWNGSNSSGFSALPGGYRDPGGSNYYYGNYASYWWSSSESGVGWGSYSRSLFDSSNGVYKETYSHDFGFYARCVRDD